MTAGEVQAGGADRELLLAQALDAYLAAGETAAGTGSAAIAASPDVLRADVAELGRLAEALAAASKDIVPASAFRASARARLMSRLAEDVLGAQTAPIPLLPRNVTPIATRRRQVATWIGRVAAGLIAISLAGFGTVNASASALPGDPLYGVKQAREVLQVSLAPDDDARTFALVQQATARVDEAARLAAAGRVDAAAAAAQRYDETVQQVSALVADAGTHSRNGSSTSNEPNAAVESALSVHQERLTEVLESAPPAAVPALEHALEVSARGLARAKGVQAARAGELRSTPGPAATLAASATATTVPAPAPALSTAVAPAATTGPADDRGRGEDRGNPGRGPAGQPGERGRPAGPPGKPQASLGSSSAQPTPTATPGPGASRQSVDTDSSDDAGAGQAADAPGQSESPGRGVGRGPGSAAQTATQTGQRDGQAAAAPSVPTQSDATATPSGVDRPGSPARSNGQSQNEGRGRGR